MSKTSTEQMRHALNGPTMGTRWTALFHTSPGFSAVDITQALQSAVDEVDNQMSTWKADSDLMRLNAAPVGEWVAIPARLMAVLELGLSIGRASGGAFDIGMGDAVRAWGFGADEAAPDRIRTAHATPRRPAHDLIELAPDSLRARKSGPLSLDLNAIAKGYGVDRLAEVLLGYDISAALVGIDGEMRGFGLRGDTQPWIVAVEDPDPQRRAAHSILGLHNAAVATSGDYRHWIDVGGRRLSHTMDPRRGAPLITSPTSVTVVAETCALADGWATALMVLGAAKGAELARARGLDALFLLKGKPGEAVRTLAVGEIFGANGVDSAAVRDSSA